MQSVFIILLFCAFLPSELYAINGKCRALVLQGGGFRGAYEIGAAKGLVKNLPKEEVSYDVIGGVSFGALNAGVLALFEIGDEDNMIDFASDLWLSMNRDDLLTSWRFGILEGLFTQKSLFDNSNLRKFYQKLHTNRTLGRNITFASLDSRTGEFLRWSEKIWQEKGLDDYIDVLISSSAFPMVFPPIKYDNRVLVDGGVLIDLDLGGVIERCREIVQRDEDIVVDIILGTAKEIKEGNYAKKTTIPSLIRVLELRAYWGAMREMAKQLVEYPEVKIRYIVKPRNSLPHPLNPTNFNRKFTEQWLAMGEADAVEVVKKGEARSVYDSLQEMRLRRTKGLF